VGDRCRFGFALAKGFVGELDSPMWLKSQSALTSKSLGEPSPLDCSVLRSPQDSSRRILRCAISFKDEGNHPNFSYNQAELLLLTDVRHQGRRDQSPFKSPSATAATRGDRPLAKKKLTVPATGDSCYWPRPEDAYYDNEPGKDFNTRLERPGAERFVEPAGCRLGYGSQSCGNSTHQAPRNLPTKRPQHPR